jgi:hypothetical protein
LLHRELYYLSERLATDLVRQTRAKKLKLRPGITASIPGVPVSPSLALTSEQSTDPNRHTLADDAMNSARDEAGTFDYPGRYLHVENCAFHLWVFSFKGLRSRQPIALCMLESLDALAILVGSAANVFGFLSEKQIDGWIPSDPGGLHYLAQFASESDFDPKTSALFRPERVETQAMFFGEEPPDLIVDGASIAASITRTPDQTGRADVLARVHAFRDHVEVPIPTRGYRQIFSQVIVGAPVFIREPSPRPLL